MLFKIKISKKSVFLYKFNFKRNFLKNLKKKSIKTLGSMNQEASRGNPSKKNWPLDVLFHSVLHYCEKEISSNINQRLPPLIHKKMLSHVLYQVRVRISRLYVVYKWNKKQAQVYKKSDSKNSYFYRLQLSIDNLQNIYNGFRKVCFKSANFPIRINQIEIPKGDFSKTFFKNEILQTQIHNSVTNAQLFHDEFTIFSKNKFQITIKFSKTIKLQRFCIYYPGEINIESTLVKKIAQNCHYILNNSSNPLYECCDFLEKIYMHFYFILVCKSLMTYKKIHKFTILHKNDLVVLNFYELRMNFSLILLQSSVYIFSHNTQANIKVPIESLDDIPYVLYKIQYYGSLFLFSQFQKRIDEWLTSSKSYSTYIDRKYCYFYFLFFDHPITKISFNSENELYCKHTDFLTSLLTQDTVLFFEYIRSFEIRIIAESAGFSRLVLYDDLSFKKALQELQKNPLSLQFLSSLGPTNYFLKNMYKGNQNTLSHFKQIMLAATRSIIYNDLNLTLYANNINSTFSEKEMLISTDTYGQIKFKIDKNGYWSIKFNQSNVLQNINMAVMFQGRTIYLRFDGWIYNLITSVMTTVKMIDQAFNQFKNNRSISVFHVIRKTALFFKSVCPPLKTLAHPTSPIFLKLQPIQFVGHFLHYDVFEIFTSLPAIKLHFVNHPNLDICVMKAIEEDLIDQRFGPFLYYLLPVFPHFFHIFDGDGWQIIDINLRGTFSLMYQSKYMVYFQQQAKNSFNVAIPSIGKSLIFNIPLSIFPLFTNQNSSTKKTRPGVRKPQVIRVTMSDLVLFRDSILHFFNEHRFLTNYGFNYIIFDPRSNLIKNNDLPENLNWIKMNVSLGPHGLNFEILDDLSNPAIYAFKYFVSMDFSSRSNQLKILTFLFDCLQIQKPTGVSLFYCLKCLLDTDSSKIDWEKTFLSSFVDVPNCVIELHLFVEDKEYKIIIDSKQESLDSEDAVVKVIKPNGDLAPVQRLKDDLEKWLNNLLSKNSTEKVLYEFSFL